MIDFNMELKNAFFDRKVVADAVDRASRKAISKSLAFIRRRQRSSIRRRNKVSQPGQPPSARSTDPVASVKNILFAYDQRTKSGIVGMVKINSRRTKIESTKELPNLLEDGGNIRVVELSTDDGKSWFSASDRQRRQIARSNPRLRQRKRSARLRKRPSAGPALEKEVQAGNVLSPWANVVTG